MTWPQPWDACALKHSTPEPPRGPPLCCHLGLGLQPPELRFLSLQHWLLATALPASGTHVGAFLWLPHTHTAGHQPILCPVTLTMLAEDNARDRDSLPLKVGALQYSLQDPCFCAL